MTHNNTAILDFDDGSAGSAKQLYNLLILSYPKYGRN
jgi:hypothetical protein